MGVLEIWQLKLEKKKKKKLQKFSNPLVHIKSEDDAAAATTITLTDKWFSVMKIGVCRK